jgi:hypothetical protein
MEHSNGWNEWSRHVLAELERLNGCYDKMNTQLGKIHVEIAMLKVKSGIWGAIGGAIPVIVLIALYFVFKK